jgi:phospholipase/carboxylesterase
VEVGPKGEAAGAVVWLHGLGASGHDFEDVVPLLQLPEVRFVFPHAPVHAVTINGGLLMPAWYDILHLGGGGERAEDIRESVQHVEALLAREQERGVAASRTVLAGFSQGGAIALFAGLRYAQTLAGVMVLSGYEVLPETLEKEAADANRMTPVLFCHGIYDPMVPIERARQAYRRCAASGRPAEWHEFPMEHQVSMEQIEVIRDWLHARLAAA